MVVDDHVTSRMVTVEGLRTLGIANIAVSSGGREAFLAMVNSTSAFVNYRSPHARYRWV